MAMRISGWVAAAFVAGAGFGFNAAEAAPPPATMGPSSYLELYGSWSQIEGQYSYYNPFWAGGFAGRANFWTNSQWSIQTDLSGDTTRSSYNGSTLNNLLAGAHVSWRDPERGLLGVFAGFAGTNDYTASEGIDGNFYAGVEGQAYFGNLTLYAQAGHLWQINGYYGPADGDAHDNWFAQLDARYFVSPNTKIEGKVGYINGSIWGYTDGEYSASGVTFGAELEHQLKTLPFSVFARFNGLIDDQYQTQAMHVYAASVGLRIRFGAADTLQGQDRNGATLSVYDFSPVGWYRWVD